ncbi:MAG TPA: trypsin-like serine protease [Solirubrobacterales bacterium]
MAASEGGFSPLILGGKGVPQGEVQSLVLVAYLIPNEKEEAVVCTGTVVAPLVVLTAAHCIEPKNVNVVVENFRVVAGSVNWKVPPRRILDVTRVTAYPGHDVSTGFGDVAVLQLASPAEVPATQVAGRHFWSGPTPAKMVGWGKTSPAQHRATYVLHRAGTVIQPDRLCEMLGAAPGLLCTAGTRRLRTSACYGDSGGPLLIRQPWDGRLVAAGVLYGGSACNRNSGVNYYTPSYRFGKWLRARIAEAEA